MKKNLKQLINKKYFHLSIILIIIISLLFVLGLLVLKYNVEGETNMPFNLSKISVISSVEGKDIESGANKWAFDVNQNNDIFIYIEKNNEYTGNEVIKTINITNIQINKNVEKGEKVIYKPEMDPAKAMFNNIEQNKVDFIEYTGAMESNIKNMQVSNQGGLIAFRYSNNKIAQYISNDDEINHSNLLKSANITEDELKAHLDFDMIIKLESGKKYFTNIYLDLPIQNVVEKGTTSFENTNLDNFIFKRVNN